MELKIEKSIPLPGNRSKGVALVLRKMVKGDSVFVPAADGSSLRNTCLYVGGKGCFATRAEKGGFRVWRIK